MTSKRVSDLLLGDHDLPTTGEDLVALRQHRPHAGSDWLNDLTRLAAQVPPASSLLVQRRTFAGLPPFEL